ncbi:MAG: hypothetical protein FWD91_08405 [Treponema sp.]|nr:hypothetical protein [Treponema sp.]
MLRYWYASFLLVCSLALNVSCTSTSAPLQSRTQTQIPRTLAEPGTNVPEQDNPFAAFRFVPQAFPSLDLPRTVGVLTADSSDPSFALEANERVALSDSFRFAYLDGLLRSYPLEGVLGGDMLHRWQGGNPSAWVQNWRTSVLVENSWGTPELLLAVQGLSEGEGQTQRRPFIVQGKLLDHYGQNLPSSGANGNAGYGAPRTYEFLYEGSLAQRFDRGLMVARSAGSTFLPGDPPSVTLPQPSGIGEFAHVDDASAIRAAFVMAHTMTVDRTMLPLIPDAPGRYLEFPQGVSLSGGTQPVKGVYLQSFNGYSTILALPDSPSLPPYPRCIGEPFLAVLLAAAKHTVSGGENLPPVYPRARNDEFFALLMQGFTRYGIPLTDAMHLPHEDQAAWREVQRFSGGWLEAPPLQ